jgi:hypothetical protein
MRLKPEAVVAPPLLALLMLTTRFHHFGSVASLPDASLAVFFLLGLFASWRWFPVFVLLAGAIDFAAVGWGGVSDFCITPAYVFLLPTYAVMTAGGHWARRCAALGWGELPALIAIATASGALAFVVSNGSFYFFSGYFGELALGDYLARTAGYFPPYVGGMLLYLVATVVVVRLARAVRAPSAA